MRPFVYVFRWGQYVHDSHGIHGLGCLCDEDGCDQLGQYFWVLRTKGTQPADALRALGGNSARAAGDMQALQRAEGRRNRGHCPAAESLVVSEQSKTGTKGVSTSAVIWIEAAVPSCRPQRRHFQSQTARVSHQSQKDAQT